LVITEEKKMPLKGASINLYTKDDRLRFELSEGNMKKESLKVSNQLIALASAGK
jgi:hypothetical protein